MLSTKKPTENTIGIVAKIRNGKLYTTEGAEKIGARKIELPCAEGGTFSITRSFYRTPKGEFFLLTETREPDERVNTVDSGLCDRYPKTVVALCAVNLCHVEPDRLAEFGISEDDREFTRLLDFRRGKYGYNNYVHHIAYKADDGSGYMVISHDEEISTYAESTFVGGEDEHGESFAEEMYVHYLTEEEMKTWVGYNLPVDIYIKLFGPVEEA